MGDLISRSAIHNKICKHFNIPKDWDGDIAEPLQTVLDLIENEDCAYDVDKVVKEFKDLKEINQYHFECEKTFENLSDAEFHRGCVEILDEAIKITENSCSNADIYGAGYKLGYEDGYKIAIDDFINQIETEIESSAKFIREYDDSVAQKAYYSGLCQSKKIAEQLKEGSADNEL